MKKATSTGNFYITTTLPYVNAPAHMGHALEFVRADIIARYKKLLGYEVFFNTGTDEHGLKIFRKAEEMGKTPQEFVDELAKKFKDLLNILGISSDVNFVRTTDKNHIKSAQSFWNKCLENGNIYKKNYKVKYCVGCELEKTDSELVNGKCVDHPNMELEVIDEENYFFRFSKFQKPLLDLYKNNPDFILPESRQNEITKFVERGLEDFSISRIKEKMPWGIPVPNDPEQVMYVWFDALTNYISVVGWPEDLKTFNKWWPAVQYCGKDNLRQQSAMWQSMLLSVGLPPSKKIIIDGFVISGGQKMSKSLGNVIDPLDIIKEYGKDSLRYFVAREISTFEDSDVTGDRLKEAYNANLANGLGNLVNRIMKMSETYLEKPVSDFDPDLLPQDFQDFLDKYEIGKASDVVWKHISEMDQIIQKTEPFKLIKVDKEKALEIVVDLVKKLRVVAEMLIPIMPDTAEKIKGAIKTNKKPEAPLFSRIK